jgi:DNA-binding transcriptional MerR regulator
MNDERLSMGEVAAHTGLAPSAIRYYEERGLLSPVERLSGRRRFDPLVLRRLSAITLATEAGFSLDEIGLMLDGESSDEWRPLIESKLDDVRESIRRLEITETLLREGLECGCSVFDACPLLTRRTAAV